MTDLKATNGGSSLTVFFSPAYIAAACEFDTTRKSGWIASSLSHDPIPGVRNVAPEPLSARQLEAVHGPEYVTAVQTGEPRELAESNGLSWDPGLWVAASVSAGGIVAAVLEAMRTGDSAGSLSSGLHHARAGSGSGFCTFNGLALAARAALNAGARRVLIIDVDAHCGGGTMSIVRDWPEVVHVDISVSRFDDYEASDHRCTLDVVNSPDMYLSMLDRRLQDLEGSSFDILIYNAGMDPHQASMGGLQGITFRGLAERERLVFSWARARRLPIGFTLAGGYVGQGLSREDLVGLHRLTITSAALANSGAAIDLHQIMESAYAGPHRGTEGFAFDGPHRECLRKLSTQQRN
jgi:acetoin utilization deacetylase AcuC-like enzyme